MQLEIVWDSFNIKILGGGVLIWLETTATHCCFSPLATPAWTSEAAQLVPRFSALRLGVKILHDMMVAGVHGTSTMYSLAVTLLLPP